MGAVQSSIAALGLDEAEEVVDETGPGLEDGGKEKDGKKREKHRKPRRRFDPDGKWETAFPLLPKRNGD